MKNYVKFTSVLALVLALSGSGCDSESITISTNEGATESTATQTQTEDTTTPTQESNTTTIKGKLIDSPVEGVNYVCADGTKGVTNEEGEFECKELPVKFMVGNVHLGEIKKIPEDSVITPQDLSGVDIDNLEDKTVTNIAILLQSLDNDGDLNNTITIDDEVTPNLKSDINLSNITEDELAQVLEDAGIAQIVPKKKALEHLQAHTYKYRKGRKSKSEDNNATQQDDNNSSSESEDNLTAETNDNNNSNSESGHNRNGNGVDSGATEVTVGAGGTGGNNKTSGGVTGETNPRYPVDPIKPPIDPVKPVNPPDIKPKPLPPLSNGGDNNTGGGVTGETNPRYPVDPIKPPIDPVEPVNPPDIKPKPLPPISNGGDNNTGGKVTGETNPKYPVDPIKPPIDPVEPVNPPDIKPKPLTPISNGGDNNSGSSTNSSSESSKDGSSNSSVSTGTAEKLFFKVDDAKGIAIDNQTHQVWQNRGISHGDRDKALYFCKSLNLAGISTWRLPTSAELGKFHKYMNEQGDVPKQAFDKCTAEITKDGYVRTLRGSQLYGKEPGASINFMGSANIRCVADVK